MAVIDAAPLPSLVKRRKLIACVWQVVGASFEDCIEESRGCIRKSWPGTDVFFPHCIINQNLSQARVTWGGVPDQVDKPNTWAKGATAISSTFTDLVDNEVFKLLTSQLIRQQEKTT